ncbi:putative non-specific serine/threonine protein kinase [Helianthus annuus]|nr:putative non-specific serine/threonine protein kinase [Helianthus annuus]
MNSSSIFQELSSSNLISLDIGSCGISSSLLDSLQNLTNLISLDLSGNQLTKRIPKSLGNFCNLREIDLWYNNIGNVSLTYFLESFFECKSSALESLSLSENYITGIIPHSIGNLSFLRTLDLTDNQISGPIPYSIGQLSSLEELYIGSNQLDGILPDSLGQLSKLTYLVFSHNLLTGVVTEAHFIKLVSLKYLDGSANKLILMLHVANWIPPFPVGNLVSEKLGFRASISIVVAITEGFRDIRHKQHRHFIAHAQIICDIPECWEKWSMLEFLNLENNSLSGEIPRTLGSLRLQYINMCGNKISGRFHSSLMNLTELDVLELGRNELTGSIPTWIGTKFTRLRILNLRSNRFDGNIPNELCHIRHIQILDLAHNNLSGNIPICFNKFSILSGIESNLGDDFAYVSIVARERPITGDSLVTNGREDTYCSILPLVMLIDLSSNNLTGYIPIELMSLLELTSLNLSRNQLSGSIPEKIGNIKELISLDLSVNRLSGELPMSLSSLHFLSRFNVSFNNLTGIIPTGTQLQSLLH